MVGCGLMAQLHASSLASLERAGVPIRAVAAADPDVAARAATNANWPFDRLHTDAHAVFGDPEVDAVFICTPTSLHRELYVAAFAAGKHLYAEKPLALNYEEAKAIAAALPDDLICQVGFQMRRHALLAEARSLVHSGDLGPVMAYSLRDDQAFPTTAFDPHVSEWRSQQANAGGGTLLEHSIHGIDIAHWIFGPPVSVTAKIRHVLGFEVEDTAIVMIEHDSGVSGTLVSVYGGVRGREESRLEIFCRDGVIEVTWGVVVECDENSLRVHRSGETPVEIDAGAALDEQLRGLGLAERPFFLNELADRAFIDSLVMGTPPTPSVDDALIAHAVVDAAYRSAASGAPVAI